MIGTKSNRNQRPRRKVSDKTAYRRKQKGADEQRLPADVLRLIFVLVVVLFTAVMCLLVGLNFFAVKHVSVVGNSRVATQRVVEASGLIGRNLFTANTDEIRLAVLNSTPLIKDVYLEYRFPDQAVVKVEERSSFAGWKVGDVTYDVSREGLVLGVWEKSSPPDVVIDAEGNPLASGDSLDSSVIECAARLERELPSAMGLEIASIRYSESRGLSVATPSGMEVLIGSGDDLDSKMVSLKSVLEECQTKNLTPQSIDVRFKNKPVFR